MRLFSFEVFFPTMRRIRRPRLKAWAEKIGVLIGSVVRVPLTTPHRRLGLFGIACDRPNVYNTEDIGFLRLVGRVVAFAIDDGLNLRRVCNQRRAE
jgi:GAF domain-containing protein